MFATLLAGKYNELDTLSLVLARLIGTGRLVRTINDSERLVKVINNLIYGL